jgi:hypothetical protein
LKEEQGIELEIEILERVGILNLLEELKEQRFEQSGHL